MSALPAVCIRVGDEILHDGTPSTVSAVERLENGPAYKITTALGDLVLGASRRVELITLGPRPTWKATK